MARYHINEKGEPGVCKAKPGNCPLAGEGEHYDSADSAREAYEAKQESSFHTSKLPSPKDEREFVIEAIKAERIKDTDVYEGSKVVSVQVGRKWVTVATEANPKILLEIGENIAVQREQYTEAANAVQEAEYKEKGVKRSLEAAEKKFESARARLNEAFDKYGVASPSDYGLLMEAQASKEIAEQVKNRQERDGVSYSEAAEGLREYYKENLANYLINTGLSRSSSVISNVYEDAKNAAILNFVRDEFYW